MSDSIEKAKIAKKPSLGRGLGSLLGAESNELIKSPALKIEEPKSGALKEGFVETSKKPEAQVKDTDRVWKISIEQLAPNPNQPRREFDKPALEELARSIKTQGILQPIAARRLANGKLEIIAGERRWRAAQLAGLHEVPVILRESGDRQSLELALIENIQRRDLNPIEEAEAYSHLMTEYHLTQQDLADQVGKDRATVANLMRLLNLHPEVRKLVATGELSQGLAKVLLAVADLQIQKQLAAKMKNEKMTVRAAERLVAQHLKSGVKVPDLEKVDISSRLMRGLADELQKLLGTKTTIDYADGKGKLSIHFHSDDEFNELVDKLRAAWHKNH